MKWYLAVLVVSSLLATSQACPSKSVVAGLVGQIKSSGCSGGLGRFADFVSGSLKTEMKGVNPSKINKYLNLLLPGSFLSKVKTIASRGLKALQESDTQTVASTSTSSPRKKPRILGLTGRPSAMLEEQQTLKRRYVRRKKKKKKKKKNNKKKPRNTPRRPTASGRNSRRASANRASANKKKKNTKPTKKTKKTKNTKKNKDKKKDKKSQVSGKCKQLLKQLAGYGKSIQASSSCRVTFGGVGSLLSSIPGVYASIGTPEFKDMTKQLLSALDKQVATISNLPRSLPKVLGGQLAAMNSGGRTGRAGGVALVEEANAQMFSPRFKNANSWKPVVCPKASAQDFAKFSSGMATTNGCSIPGGWAPYVKTFTDACMIHDFCYMCGNLKATRRSRAQCDEDFYLNNISQCYTRYCRKYSQAIQRGWCFIAAGDYASAVMLAGKKHYGKGGKTAASSCPSSCSKAMMRHRFRQNSLC